MPERGDETDKLLAFLQTELATASRMLDDLVTINTAPDRERARHALAKAERARAELLRCLGRAASRGMDTTALSVRADELGRKIVDMRRRLARGSGA